MYLLKLPPISSKSDIGVSLSPNYSTSSSAYVSGKAAGDRPKCLGSCHPHRRPRCSRLQTVLAMDVATIWTMKQHMEDLTLSVSLLLCKSTFISNKLKKYLGKKFNKGLYNTDKRNWRLQINEKISCVYGFEKLILLK